MTNKQQPADEAAGFAIVPRWLLFDERVSPHAKLVFAYLSARSNGEHQSFPRHRRIATELGISVSSVQRGLRELRALGYVSWRQRLGDNGSLTSNAYSLSIEPRGRRDRTPRSHGSDPSVTNTEKREPLNESQRTRARVKAHPSGSATTQQLQLLDDMRAGAGVYGFERETPTTAPQAHQMIQALAPEYAQAAHRGELDDNVARATEDGYEPSSEAQRYLDRGDFSGWNEPTNGIGAP